MESKPPVEAGPPALIESAVGLLTPPCAREPVLGDLAERYSSPGQYVLDAARTVPFVVASQIRRTSYFPVWPMVVMMLTTGFGAGAKVSWLQGAIPALATLIGFMFRDAYRIPDLRHPWRQGLVDVAAAAGTALAFEAVLAAARPQWLIAPAGLVGGGVILAVLYLLRLQNPSGRVPSPVPASGPQTFDDLRGEIAIYERGARRGAMIEIVAGCAVVPVFAASAVLARPPLVRIGSALTVAGILFVAWYIRRGVKSAVPIPTEAGFAATAAGYRARLERHHDTMRRVWLWYLLPLAIGPAVILGGAAMAAPRADATLGALIMFIATWFSVAWNASHRARALRERMAAIDGLEEQR